MQRHLQHLDQIEVAGENVSLFAKRTHLHTAAASARARIGKALPLTKLLLDHGVGVEYGRKSIALAHDPQCMVEKDIGAPVGELDVRAGLKEMHLIHDVEE